MDCHHGDLGGAAAPIAKAGGCRRCGSSLAEIVIWTADTAVRRSCDEEPAGTHFLDDDRGTFRRDDEEVLLRDSGTAIVDLRMP